MCRIRYIITDNQLIQEIKSNRDWAINQLYLKYSESVERYIMHKGATLEESKSCCHDAIIFTIRKAKEGALDNNEGTVLPYLKRVADIKRKCALRKRKNRLKVISIVKGTRAQEETKSRLTEIIEEETKSNNLSILKDSFAKLKDKCKTIISMSFFEDPPVSNDLIAKMVGLGSANSVGVTKTRCLNSLRDSFFNSYNPAI